MSYNCFSAAYIFYYDSLAWAVHHDFRLKIAFLTSLIKEKYPCINDFEIHVVNKNTEKNSVRTKG